MLPDKSRIRANLGNSRAQRRIAPTVLGLVVIATYSDVTNGVLVNVITSDLLIVYGCRVCDIFENHN